MNTLIDPVLDNPLLMTITVLALLLAGHTLRRLAGLAGSLLERR